MPRPLLQRIIDVDRDQRPEIGDGWVTAALLAIRSTLHDLDHPEDEEEDDVTPRPALRVVTDEEEQPSPWWHRFVNHGR
ncbi:hypothetical protein [Amycolatopsis keratiniphila]|uniref:Uncharacterized protein n=1 Tax=Amycolatopsis keratiniphila subsp. keratiniphila TaxID=227715 RepID=A0A1W2M482_9PSEU|nr:hypothetical protein [Amycolatopsis keratiniphila]ONF75014.1 hypothetical protein AVR91_0200400 [Amycolatopsis keratiniphila subsp. keratiniphila]